LIDTRKRSGKPSVDSSPLDLAQLSDEELMVVFGIERRLREAAELTDDHESSRAEQSLRENKYLADAVDRYPRVLLLDGGRGTGKTSILLTLAKRWRVAAGLHDGDEADLESEVADRINHLRDIHQWIPEEGKSPSYVRVVPILDFDPLPAEMPLVAGIIQAWRPLAERYGSPNKRDDICEDDDDTLLDLWHRLFRVAAVGWTPIPKHRGLIEQVLDQEEQVRDWQRLDKQWRDFVDAALARGKCLGERDRLAENPVFVVMIDDVDLQVGRIRELLPALRMLYHPRVFFLVAADRRHMIDMLKLDFLGKQNELARHTNASGGLAIDLAGSDRWASDLAESAFEKVFPRRSRWNLKRLDLLGFLSFPKQYASTREGHHDDGTSFLSILNQIKRRPQKTDDKKLPTIKEAGAFIQQFGEVAGSKLPGVMTYRAVHQLREHVGGISKSRPAQVLARLLAGNDDATAAAGEDVEADVQSVSVSATTPALQDTPDGEIVSNPVVLPTERNNVDVHITGELAALYRAGPTELSGEYNIVLSARPDFVFIRPGDAVPIRMSATTENRFNFTAALTAKALEIAGFPVDAAGLQWNTYLSLAWTEWYLGLSFAWTRHLHPRPDQLLEQTNTWSKFLRIELEPADKIERYAYSWIYYQRLWAGHPADVSDPAEWTADSDLQWDRLVNFSNLDAASLEGNGRVWLSRTLPLLARPEIGFPPKVQAVLLEHALKGDVASKLFLKNQRRRLVTDAFVAAGIQRGKDVTVLPKDTDIEDWIKTIDRRYGDVHPEPSPWIEIEAVDDPSGSKNGTIDSSPE
jgi:hypothetical protein